MSSTNPSPALFFETVNAYQRTESLRAAIELGVFSHIATGKRTVTELATACQAAEHGIRILVDYLTIIGFLRKQNDHYELTDDSATFLVPSSPAYLGGTLNFLLTPQIRDCFGKLAAAVRLGGTAISDEGTVSYDNPVWVDFARAMGPMMFLPAQMLANFVWDDPQQPIRVLDVAAGHGLFGITIAQRFPQSHITALDWENVLAVATENAQKAKVADRHSLIAGSAFEVDWGGPYDIVLLTNFLHHFDLPTCQQIATKACAALKPGGRMLTLEFVPDSDRINPPSTATFALTMLATTAHGDAYTFPEYQKVFEAAGFIRSEFHALQPTAQQLIVSHKK